MTRATLPVLLLVWATSASAAAVSVVSPTNGLTDIYSASFDGAMIGPADSLFGGALE